MTLAGPILPVIGPLLAGALLLLLRRWPAASVGGGLLTLLWLRSGLQAIAAGESSRFAGATWTVLGRDLILSDGARAVLLLLYGGLALLFLLSLLAPQGRLFVAGGVALLSPLAAALLVTPFTYGAVALVFAGGFLAVLIQTQAGSTQGALRLLLMFSLAVPLLLILGWMMENDQGAFATTTGRLLLLALIILLAGFPFHLWVGPILREAPSLVPGLIFGLVQLLVLLFIVQRIDALPPTVARAEFTTVLRWSGGATLALGALLALQAARPQRLLAILLLIDGGLLLLGLSLITAGDGPGLDLLLALLLQRFAALTLAGFGLSLVSAPSAAPETDGATRRLSLVLFSYGALSLVGLPLTPGFSSHGPLLLLLAAASPALGTVAVLAAAAGTLAVIRSAARLWATVPPSAMLPLRLPAGSRRTQAMAISRLAALLLLLAGGVVLATTPSLLATLAGQLATFLQ